MSPHSYRDFEDSKPIVLHGIAAYDDRCIIWLEKGSAVQNISPERTWTQFATLFAGQSGSWWCTTKRSFVSKSISSSERSKNSGILIIWTLTVTMTLKASEPIFLAWRPGSWLCTTIASLVTKSLGIQKISSGQNPYTLTNGHVISLYSPPPSRNFVVVWKGEKYNFTVLPQSLD